MSKVKVGVYLEYHMSYFKTVEVVVDEDDSYDVAVEAACEEIMDVSEEQIIQCGGGWDRCPIEQGIRTFDDTQYGYRKEVTDE